MERANMAIRKKLKANGIFQWQLADKLGITETRFIILLRKELPKETQQRYINLIDTIEKID